MANRRRIIVLIALEKVNLKRDVVGPMNGKSTFEHELQVRRSEMKDAHVVFLVDGKEGRKLQTEGGR